jgi:uncharacterized protein YbjT (DUF2867 family)
MNNHKETILVTGATGTVGSEVVKHLAGLSPSSDYNVKAAIHSKNKSDQLRQFENKGVEIVDLDFTKQETVTRALNNVDKVFIQTIPVPNVADISSNLINEAKKNDVKYVVKLSAMGAGSEPESTILRVHGEEEKIIQDSGIPYTFLRPPAFMQNFVTQLGHTIRTQKCILYSCRRRKDEFYRC